MPARLDIALQRNEDWSRTLTLTDFDGNPLDLNGCSLAMQVREKLAQASVASATIDMLAPEAGMIAVTLRASQGSPLASYGTPIQVANLHYDLLMTDSGGSKVALLAGLVILSRGETVA